MCNKMFLVETLSHDKDCLLDQPVVKLLWCLFSTGRQHWPIKPTDSRHEWFCPLRPCPSQHQETEANTSTISNSSSLRSLNYLSEKAQWFQKNLLFATGSMDVSLEWTPGVGDGQGGLACCDSWGRKESDTTEQLNWTELKRVAGDEMVRWHHCAQESEQTLGDSEGEGSLVCCKLWGRKDLDTT